MTRKIKIQKKRYKDLKFKHVKEMNEVFKRKSGPHVKTKSRTKERQQWQKEWRDEI